MSHGTPEQEHRNAGPEGSLGEIIHEDYNYASRGGEMRDGVEAYTRDNDDLREVRQSRLMRI